MDSDIALDIQNLHKKVEEANLPKELHDRALGQLSRLQKMATADSYSREFESTAEYINWITRIPWGKGTSDNLDLDHASAALSKNHYGLQPVKDRILEYLAILNLKQRSESANQSAEDNSISETMVAQRSSSSNAPVLCFVGIQGVGKTTMAKSIASALGRGFARIPLGGMGGVGELRGISKTNPDAEPGQIIKSMIATGSMNPIILLDEIDKVSSQTGLRADIMASLLEILDPEQNSTFSDKYLDYPINLSNIIFITTANNLGGISAALLDRLEVIRFGSYNDKDKVYIAKNYLLPKVRKATGMGEDQLTFDDSVWDMVVRPLGFDAGVRQLERTLSQLARKVALQIVKGTVTKVHLTPENFRQYIPEQIGVFS